MPPETEVIKQQMGHTRAALTEKLETLEEKVFGTVHTTTSTVSDTVQTVGTTVSQSVNEVGASFSQTVNEVSATVRETAQDLRATVDQAMSSVREALDVTRQVHEHPWLMVGSSVVAGYVGGRVLESIEGGRFPSHMAFPVGPEQLLPEHSEFRERIESEPVPRRSGSFFLKALTDTFAPELNKLKRVALGVAMGLMRDKMSESVPSQLRGDLTDIIDRFTVKLGGQPTPPGYGPLKGDDREEHNGSEMAGMMRGS
jgi:ElaB/YqjD/DUF883 family membrane-anchored ribosome-binding protein